MTLAAPHSLAPLLKIDEATVVKGQKKLLDGLSLEIAEGQHTAILGPNGAGKSSLIKLITRQHYPLMRKDGQPTVTIFGRSRWDVFQLRSLMGIVSSELQQTFTTGDATRGLDAVISGLFASKGVAPHHKVTSAMRERAESLLTQLQAEYLAERTLETMSTGEARRILIARALMPQPRALLLDEPTTGLDIVARQRFLETLRGIARGGTTVILVTHHVEEILPEIERVMLLREGRIFLDGTKTEMMHSAHLSATFGAPITVQTNEDYYSAEVALSAAKAPTKP